MIRVREMRSDDWPAVASVYAEGIATRNATFETEPPSWEAWNGSHLPDQRLVAAAGDSLLGFAALSPVSDRCCYRGVASVSVYVTERARGRGLGRTLLSELIDSSEQAGLWTVQAGVFPENEASLRLHEGCGFRRVGIRERLGQLDGVWRDVVMLERRSPAIA